jgi:hypothetical protein
MKSKEDIMATTMHDPHGEEKQIININTNIMSDLQKTGTIIEILPIQKGTSKAGKEWQKQNFIIDTNETYNNIICFGVFGEEKVENLNKYNKVGDVVTVTFNVSCNKWAPEGKEVKYFTSLDAWRIDKTDGKPSTQDAPAATEEDDLPF